MLTHDALLHHFRKGMFHIGKGSCALIFHALLIVPANIIYSIVVKETCSKTCNKLQYPNYLPLVQSFQSLYIVLLAKCTVKCQPGGARRTSCDHVVRGSESAQELSGLTPV